MMIKPTVAAFDFDGTITTKDTLLPFLRFVAGRRSTMKKLTFLSPVFFKYLLGLSSRQETTERVLTSFLSGMPYAWLLALGEMFAVSPDLHRLVLPAAQERIRWHMQQGHRCIIVSASIDAYLHPWGRACGVHDVISSQLHIADTGLVTGTLKGLNCWGPEKVRRLVELLGPREEYILYAYGNSRGDKELLDTADYPFYRSMPL